MLKCGDFQPLRHDLHESIRFIDLNLEIVDTNELQSVMTLTIVIA